MFGLKTKGSWSNTMTFLDRIRRSDIYDFLDSAGQKGVSALSSATPQETGETSRSWDYRIIKGSTFRRIEWFNTNENDGVFVAVLIQYGHGTRDGTFVEGKDYINPAMRPVFDEIANELWKKVMA